MHHERGRRRLWMEEQAGADENPITQCSARSTVQSRQRKVAKGDTSCLACALWSSRQISRRRFAMLGGHSTMLVYCACWVIHGRQGTDLVIGKACSLEGCKIPWC